MQENWQADRPNIDVVKLRQTGRQVLAYDECRYDLVMYCGDVQGVPALTFAASVTPTVYARPAPIYLCMIAEGLAETYAMDPWQIIDYLSSMPGVKGQYNQEELKKLFKHCGVRVN